MIHTRLDSQSDFQWLDEEMRNNHTAVEVKCKHGHIGYCGLCSAEAAPKCEHGNAFYCGFCLAETGDGIVRGQKGGLSK